MIRPVRPWRRIPRSWICAECQQAATGVISVSGLAIFYCSEHYDALSDWVMDTLGYGSAQGYYRLRYEWGETLQNYGWRLAHLPSARKRKRAGREEEAQLEAIFGPYEYDPAKALLSRTRGAHA